MSRYLMWSGLLMIAGMIKTEASEAPAGMRDEQEIAAFIVRVAQSDLNHLERVAELMPGNWSLQRSSRNQTTGWIINEAKSIYTPPWLSNAMHRAYVEPDVSNGDKTVITSVDLSVEFREESCFTGEQFKERKYDRGGLEEWILAQPTDGNSGVSPRSIEHRDVHFHHQGDSDCIWKIVFFGKRSADGGEH